MRFGGITRGAVVALALSATLAACSSDPEVLEPEPSATSESPSASASPPTMPAQASENTPEGAASFVQHYIDVFNYAASTGDVKKLSSLSSPNCDGCQSYITLYRDTYQAGGYIRGGLWSLGELKLDFGEPETYATTDVGISAGSSKRASGANENDDAPSTESISLAVTRGGDAWVVSQFGLGEAE